MSSDECDQPLVLFLLLTCLEMLFYTLNAVGAFFFATNCMEKGDPLETCPRWIQTGRFTASNNKCCKSVRDKRGVYYRCKRIQKWIFVLHLLVLTGLCAVGTFWEETTKDCDNNLKSYATSLVHIFWTGFGLCFAGTFLFFCCIAWISGKDIWSNVAQGYQHLLEDSDVDDDVKEVDEEKAAPVRQSTNKSNVKSKNNVKPKNNAQEAESSYQPPPIVGSAGAIN